MVSRGCPHHCDFCYKDAFFEGGNSYYTQLADAALAEIDRLPGRHLYFLDDHLLGHQRFAASLFEGMKGMNRVFQGASTIDAILRGDLIEAAAGAGMRSVFVGFETLSRHNLVQSNKRQNIGKDYEKAIQRLHSLTTCTFHILTPYPGTRLFRDMNAEELKKGYDWAYRSFYSWGNILKASTGHEELKHMLKHFAYAGGWKKFEPLWNFMIKTQGLNKMLPLLESILSKVKKPGDPKPGRPLSHFPAIA